MVARPLAAQQLPAQIDHRGQVQVVPLNQTVIHPFEAAVKPAAQVHHQGVWMAGQEIPGVAVELAEAQDDGDFVFLVELEAREIVIQVLDQVFNRLIFEDGIRALAFAGTNVKREQQGFGNAS